METCCETAPERTREEELTCGERNVSGGKVEGTGKREAVSEVKRL